MRKFVLVPTIAVLVVAMSWSQAFAGDHFEAGFQYEMGAIAARATVGLGLGLIHGAFHGPPHHHHRHCGHHYVSHHRPHYRKVVVYRPHPVPVHHVERRIVHYPARRPVYGPLH